MLSSSRLSLMVLLLAAMSAQAQIAVEDAYVRGLPPGTANTSAYMVIRNNGSQDMVLVGADTPVAGSVMLHETVILQDMMHMQHLATADIPAGAELVLESGGKHLMLMNLQSMPMPGTLVPLSLRFADGSVVELSVPVRSVLEE